MVNLTMSLLKCITSEKFENTICFVLLNHCKITIFTYVTDTRSFKRRTFMICHGVRHTTITLYRDTLKDEAVNKTPCPQTQHSDFNAQFKRS